MRPRGKGRATTVIGLLLCAAAGLWDAAPASAIPPPPPRPQVVLDLRPDGSERIVEDEVRAYQYVPLSFHARAGDELLLSMATGEHPLVLDLEAPSGLRWIVGASPGPDGMRLRMMETGVHRLYVVMSSDAARAGRTAGFRLGLRLRR